MKMTESKTKEKKKTIKSQNLFHTQTAIRPQYQNDLFRICAENDSVDLLEVFISHSFHLFKHKTMQLIWCVELNFFICVLTFTLQKKHSLN